MKPIHSLLALAALILPSVIAQHDITTTTTIPYLGWPTKTTTLPPCSGTVTVVVETRLHGIDKCRHHSTKTHHTQSTTASSSPTAKPTGACLNINPLCPAKGFNIDYYHNMLGGYSDPYNEIYSNYYIVDGLKPLKSSLTQITYFQENQPGTGAQSFPNSSLALVPPFTYTQFPSYAGYTRETNGGIVVDANNFTLVYQGFFKPKQSGLWQICASADNENDIYFGDGNAFPCGTGRPGTADDPIVKASGGYYNNAPECAQVNLTAGFYYPIRTVMANWQGPSGFNMTHIPPGGSTLDGDHDWTGLVYPMHCGIFV